MVGSARVPTPPQALFVSYTSILGGAERILLDHADALPEPVALACPEGPLADEARAAEIAVLPLRQRRVELRASARDRLAMPARMGLQSLEIRKIVTQRRPRCVIAWGMRALLSCAGALRGLRPPRPFAFHHHDLLPSPIVARAVRTAARRADLVVALSQTIANDLDPNGDLGGRSAVVRAGVDLSRFRPAGPPPADPPTALVLGAIVGWKRPDLALDAVALAARELPDVRVRVAGAPLGEDGAALARRLERRAAEPELAGRVDLLGGVGDVPAELARATCLLHCADREPYGMALAEALACGRPVVAPVAGGPTEIVDASCGVLYRPGDVHAAATALRDAVAHADQLGLGARARAESELDRSVASERFAALIEELTA